MKIHDELHALGGIKLIGESRREHMAERIVEESVLDNALLALNESIITGNYGESSIDSTEATVIYRFERYKEALNTLELNRDPSVRLYREATAKSQLMSVVNMVVKFFKNIPNLVMKIISSIGTLYRSFKVRSAYLINRRDFFNSFPANVIKDIRKKVAGAKDESSEKHKPWIDKHYSKLSKIKLTGDDDKDYYNILKYVVGYFPVKAYTMGEIGKVDTEAVTAVFGSNLVGAIGHASSIFADMEKNNFYVDASGMQAIAAIEKQLQAYDFMRLSSVTSDSSFANTPLTGAHNLITAGDILISGLSKELVKLEDDPIHRDEKGNAEGYLKNEVQRMLKLSESIKKSMDAVTNATRIKTNKTKSVKLTAAITLSFRLQATLFGIFTGNHEGPASVHPSTLMDTWSQIKSDKSRIDVGVLSKVNTAKAIMISTFKDIVIDSDSTEKRMLHGTAFDVVDKVASGAISLQAPHVKSIYIAEDAVKQFLNAYSGDDATVKNAISDYVAVYTHLFTITSNITKVMAELAKLVDQCNNYRMALLSDLSHRMQTVADMFSMTEAIKVRLEEDKVKAKAPDTEKHTSKGASPVAQISFNS